MGHAIEKIEPEQTAITPAAMINQAIASGAGVEVMERLLALQERYDGMHARKAYDNSIADLRANLPDIIKSQEGYGYKYEDLSDIVRQVSPVMAERGLSFRWRTGSDNGTVTVSCIISHRDGHSEETTLSAQPDTSGSKNSIQAIGSAVTYLQRYTLKAALGIAASKDDDGASVGQQRQSKPAKPASKDTTARAIYTQAEHDIRQAGDIDALKAVWVAIMDRKANIPADWLRDLTAEKDARKDALSKPKARTEPNFDNLDSDPFPGDLPEDEHGHTAADYLNAG